jgi:hypothetical protein
MAAPTTHLHPPQARSASLMARCPPVGLLGSSTHHAESCTCSIVRPISSSPPWPRVCQETARARPCQPRETHLADFVQKPQSPSKTSNGRPAASTPKGYGLAQPSVVASRSAPLARTKGHRLGTGVGSCPHRLQHRRTGPPGLRVRNAAGPPRAGRGGIPHRDENLTHVGSGAAVGVAVLSASHSIISAAFGYSPTEISGRAPLAYITPSKWDT